MRTQRQTGRLLGRERQRFVARVGVQRLRAAQYGRHRLQRRADHVDVGLLRGQGGAGGLGVETQHPGPLIFRAEPVPHQFCIQPARGSEFGDLLEEVVMRVEKERKPRRKRIDVETRRQSRFDIGDGIGESEGHFLNRCGSGFPDMVTADGNGIPFWQMACAKLDGVGDEPHRGTRREDKLFLCDVLFKDVVLNRSA